MKAAVVYKKGESPKYAEFAEPIPQNENQILLSVKAVAITNLDKGKASGKHYSSDNHNENGFVVSSDAVGLLENGTKFTLAELPVQWQRKQLLIRIFLCRYLKELAIRLQQRCQMRSLALQWHLNSEPE